MTSSSREAGGTCARANEAGSTHENETDETAKHGSSLENSRCPPSKRKRSQIVPPELRARHDRRLASAPSGAMPDIGARVDRWLSDGPLHANQRGADYRATPLSLEWV